MKGAEWVKTQRQLETINVQKINNSFRFINDLLSLDDDNTFEKHFKDIYPTEVELKKGNNNNSCAFTYVYLCTFTLKMENPILNYLTNEIILTLTL